MTAFDTLYSGNSSHARERSPRPRLDPRDAAYPDEPGADGRLLRDGQRQGPALVALRGHGPGTARRN